MGKTDQIPQSQRKLAALTDAERLAVTDVDFDGCAVAKTRKAFKQRVQQCGGSELTALRSDRHWGESSSSLRERMYIAAVMIRENPGDEATKAELYPLLVEWAGVHYWNRLPVVRKACSYIISRRQAHTDEFERQPSVLDQPRAKRSAPAPE